MRADGKPYIREMLNLSVGEKVYGLGNNSAPSRKTARQWYVDEDGGTCTETAYKNVPFYLTTGDTAYL